MARRFKPKSVYITDDTPFEHHGATLLLLIREGVVHDWQSLCKAFNFNPRAFHSGHLGLKRTLEQLMQAGLLTSRVGYKGPYEITDLWQEVKQALGISLIQAANLTHYDSIAVRPFFFKPPALDNAPHVFALMPFDKSLKPTYDSVKRVCRMLKISVERADDIFSASAVINDIWAAIYNAGVIVADCTSRNPNVFYEIGIAHTIGKPVILISQRAEDVPFDVKYIRYIHYSPTLGGLRELQQALRRTLKEVGKTVWGPPSNPSKRTRK